MSPVGGVGINLAVQDAVAAARILANPLRRGTFWGHAREVDRVLARVQRRRTPPTVMIQALQRFIHRLLIMPALSGAGVTPPRRLIRLLGRLLGRLPGLTVVPAFIIGVGPRPEKAPTWARRPASTSS
jgi:2-polyprenyl-6-methoxyphenol hydroxylase-like FAD-dependent oxidoreductase